MGWSFLFVFGVLCGAQEVKIGDEQEVKPSTEAYGVVMCIHGRVMS